MLPWQPFLAFYLWGAHWCHLKNTTEPSMCGGDTALCQITLTTYYYYYCQTGLLTLNMSPGHLQKNQDVALLIMALVCNKTHSN